MLTLNTNLSSIVAQNSLKNSTTKLNQAIERMTTGYKINHASDNAANYSISSNMSGKISSYMVAEDNTSMGLDLITTATDILSMMQDKAARLSALSTQARNGTYGASSLAAINAEANAIISELRRDYNSAQYNNNSIFNTALNKLPDDMPKAGESGFINETAISTALKAKDTGFIDDIVEETPDIIVSDPNQLASAISSKNKIGIANAETLAKLAELVNSGTNCSAKTIILTDDIDLSAYENWTPIGTNYRSFNGYFNGNGHVVKNLTINRPTEDYVGLFGYSSVSLENVGIENANVIGNSYVGGLAGYMECYITNSYATGKVTGDGYVGGLAGSAYSITNSYSTGNVTGDGSVGGLAGLAGDITNSYATGNVTGSGNYVGGLAGYIDYSITNSYSTGNVTGNSTVGGLVGYAGDSITNSYSTGNVTGSGNNVSGLAGYADSITTSYSLGDVNRNTEKLYYLSDGSTTQIDTTTTLQVGINGDSSSRITTDTSFIFNFSSLQRGMENESTFAAIQEFNNLLSQKQTELGAVSNRLESVLDEIAIKYDNLVSSRSTLRDADIAEVSAEYIQQQILQQASATLLSTANQSPSIALQLI